MEKFKASTQYGDWEGTASADNAHNSIHDYLLQQKLMEEGEFLVGVSLYSSENSIYMRAFVLPGKADFKSVKDALDSTDGPISVREVNLTLKLEEFLDLFKRFDVVLTSHGLELEGREYSVIGR
jgi:hypothetical protein